MEFRLLLTLVLSTHVTVLSSEISVFVRTGASVQLDIQTHDLPKFDDLSWRNDKSENIVKYFNRTKEVRPHPSYKDRVDFNNKTFSLTLKNMQKTDSGLFTARASGESENNIVTYRVSVIDAVEAPALTVTPNSSSPETCRFTCNGSNITVSFIYDSSSCSPEELTSSDNSTLRLICSGDSIMCNHSNPVSWKTDTKVVDELCPVNKGEQEASAFPPWVIAIICIFSVTLVAVISFCIYKGIEGAQKNEQSIYAEVDSSSLTEKSKPDATATTIYCAIQQQPNPPKTEAENTIYAVVDTLPTGYESAHSQSE